MLCACLAWFALKDWVSDMASALISLCSHWSQWKFCQWLHYGENEAKADWFLCQRQIFKCILLQNCGQTKDWPMPKMLFPSFSSGSELWGTGSTLLKWKYTYLQSSYCHTPNRSTPTFKQCSSKSSLWWWHWFSAQSSLYVLIILCWKFRVLALT